MDKKCDENPKNAGCPNGARFVIYVKTLTHFLLFFSFIFAERESDSAHWGHPRLIVITQQQTGTAVVASVISFDTSKVIINLRTLYIMIIALERARGRPATAEPARC